MDPDEALKQLRQAIVDWENADNKSEEASAAERATSAAGALDDWLSKGGFLPVDWRVPHLPDNTEAWLTRALDLSNAAHAAAKKAQQCWLAEKLS